MRFPIMILSLLLACTGPTTLPELGDSYPIPSRSIEMMIASSQSWPYEEILISGINYSVAINKSTGKVAYVSTQDSKFKTPEGLFVGATLEQVLATGAEEPWREPGWAYHTKLPSGWSAAFIVGRGMTDGPLQPTSKVSWFFKRR